ncbi:hypothetical protein BGLT_02828 [Caballeronia glathei]|uniref:hypothetical protein n=1 Tax=Caballeronia glathei TaxID=60547 RepID=UPI000506A864|nr:hypothetical protein [Caballeronia glathei]CDY73456.1 hypothetical protein BGLT_02828 [Caballeronia glathei]
MKRHSTTPAAQTLGCRLPPRNGHFQFLHGDHVVGAVDPDHVHHKVTLLCAEAGVDKAAAAVVTSAVNAFVLVIMRD